MREVQFLKHTRHRGHEGGPHFDHVPREGLRRFGKCDGGAGVEVRVEHHPLERVAEREER